MARAETVTWLSLDRWVEVLGGDMLHFNGVETALRPLRSGCEDTWLQFDWQNVQQVSRESLAWSIQDAEQQIADYVGYNLLPDYEVDERKQTEKPGMPELFSVGRNIRGQWKNIETDKKHVISGGIKSRSVIQAAAAVVRSDADGDGYNELATVTVATTITADDEIRAFFPGENGDDEWEIRPITVSTDGVNAIITFKIWQLVDPDLQIALNSENAVDGDTAGNFLSTVDIYRVFTDIETQVQFLWEPFPSCTCDGTVTCTTCQHSVQNGCLIANDFRLGRFQYVPSTFDSDDQEFAEAEFAIGREPDQLRLWYFSGWQKKSLDRPLVTLDPVWERAIAYLAIGLLDREICHCDNVLTFYQWWREDVARIDENRTLLMERFLNNNPFGSTSRGAFFAWQQCNRRGRILPD